MVTVNGILDAVCAAVRAVLPGEPCYTNLQPRDGRRPCTLVTVEKLTLSDLNAGTVQLEAVVKAAALVEADPYRHSQFEVLAARQALKEYNTGDNVFLTASISILDVIEHISLNFHV